MGWNDRLDDPNAYESHIDRLLQRGDELRKELRETIGHCSGCQYMLYPHIRNTSLVCQCSCHILKGETVALACNHVVPVAENGTASCAICAPGLQETPL